MVQCQGLDCDEILGRLLLRVVCLLKHCWPSVRGATFCLPYWDHDYRSEIVEREYIVEHWVKHRAGGHIRVATEEGIPRVSKFYLGHSITVVGEYQRQE